MDASDDLRTPGGLTVPAAALIWTFARAGGPGGQHVNKTSSKATLTIRTATIVGSPDALERIVAAAGDEVRVSAQTNRSQWRNRQRCRSLAAELLDDAARIPDPARQPTTPTLAAVERRLDAKRHTADKKAARRNVNW